MERRQFERMISNSGLHHVFTIASQIHFMVALHVEKQFGIQYMNDTLAFGRDEFAAMTEEEASFHINACKSRLEHAATTKTPAWLYYPTYLEQQRKGEPQRQTQQRIPVNATVQAVNYPAH